jgi:hypothetical protein
VTWLQIISLSAFIAVALIALVLGEAARRNGKSETDLEEHEAFPPEQAASEDWDRVATTIRRIVHGTRARW